MHIGYAGVDIFFVISGFIMFVIAGRVKTGHAGSESLRFLAKRAARIYPLFWFTLAVFLLLPTQAWRRAHPSQILQHPQMLLLVEAPGPLHPVAWTLVCEVAFYLAVAALIFINARRRTVAFLALFAVQTIVVLASANFLHLGLAADPITLEFGLGA